MTEKNTKKNIFLLTAMVLILLVASGTATYAWFSTSARLDIQGVNFYARVNDKLKISVDAIEWSSSVKGSDFEVDLSDLKDVYPSTYLGYNLFDEENAPFRKLINNTSENKSVSFYTYPEEFKVAEKNADYFVAPIYLQSTSLMDIYLDENSYIMPYTLSENGEFNKDYIAGAARVGIFTEDGTPIVVWAANAAYQLINLPNGTAEIVTDGKDIDHNKAFYVDGHEYEFVSTLGSNFNTEYKIYSELEPYTTVKLYIVYWIEGEDSEAVSAFSGGQMIFNVSFHGVPLEE